MSDNNTTAPRSGGRLKGIVAIAAGAALLVGGTGVFAYWSTQQSLSVDDVQAGDLDLTLGDGEWTLDGVLGTPNVIPAANLGNVRIVPGDVLTLAQDIDVTLVGTTIEAILATDLTGVVPAGLASYVDIAFDPGVGTAEGTNAVRLVPADSGTIEATVTITFDPATPDQDGTNETLDLSALTFTLTQADS